VLENGLHGRGDRLEHLNEREIQMTYHLPSGHNSGGCFDEDERPSDEEIELADEREVRRNERESQRGNHSRFESARSNPQLRELEELCW